MGKRSVSDKAVMLALIRRVGICIVGVYCARVRRGAVNIKRERVIPCPNMSAVSMVVGMFFPNVSLIILCSMYPAAINSPPVTPTKLRTG